ncbi:MAG TPA: hypothetical protein PLW86_04185 [Rhodocyclaceae bacterium]|nr:hypothetical protein [Rhodocyclaceae bacterium]
MHPVYDVDALLMLATTLSSKRRPATLAEIIAALDLMQGAVTYELRWGDVFHRLSTSGLICEADGGYRLTEAGEAMMADLPKKHDTDKRVFAVKAMLTAYIPADEFPAIVLSKEQVNAASLVHRGSATGTGKNLLVPKPKPVEPKGKRPGPWRKPGARRGGKSA